LKPRVIHGELLRSWGKEERLFKWLPRQFGILF
jgi:hypothetical protein